MLVALGELAPEDHTMEIPADQSIYENGPYFDTETRVDAVWRLSSVADYMVIRCFLLCIRLGASALLYFQLSHLLAPFLSSFSYIMSMTFTPVGY